MSTTTEYLANALKLTKEALGQSNSKPPTNATANVIATASDQVPNSNLATMQITSSNVSEA